MKHEQKNKQDQENLKRRNSPEGSVPAQNQKESNRNEANYQGAIDTGTNGTKATASQQQGQGLKSAKDLNKRSGSDSGQNTNKKTR